MLLPSTSAQMHSLECVRIDDPTGFHLWAAVPGTSVGTLLDQEAAELLDVVASLPNGEIMRCFVPGFGIRARSADGAVLFEVAFCFQCNNALILRPEPDERQDFVGFNAESRQGQELLARFGAF